MKSARRCIVGLVLCLLGGVAMANPVSFADLARHARYKMVKISPDGRYVAVTAVVRDRTMLSVIRLSDLHGFNLEPHDNADVIDFWWASPTRVIYTQGVRDSNFDAPLADGQLFGVNADGSGRDLLYGYGSHNPYYGAADLISALPGDPGHVLVSVSNLDAATSDGVLPVVEKMSVTSGQMTKVMTAPARNVDFIADHAGHVRFAYGVDNEDNVRVYTHPAGEGDWQLLPEIDASRDLPLAFGANDKFAYFDCNVPAGFGICKWDPATRKLAIEWSNPHVTATGLASGPEEDHFIGVNFEDGRPGVALFDPHDRDAEVLASLVQQFPGEGVQFVSSTQDGSKAIVAVESDTDPGAFYLYDRVSRTLRLLFRAAPWIGPEKLAAKQPFEFSARDGMRLQGYVTYPPGQESARSLPLVVYVHGGPYGVRDWWDYDPDVQAVATRGYAVLQVNYRGSGGYGYAFQKAGWRQWGGKMQDDVADATRWAIAQGIADPNRICIYGASYGGYAALEGAVKDPGLYKCAIGYVGVYDLGLMYERGDIPDTTYGKNYLKRVLGTDRKTLAALSPVNQVGRLRAKVMLIVGGEDARVPPLQGQEMRKALRAKGIPCEWLYRDKEAHGFYKEANVADLYANVDAFLDANIGPGKMSMVAGTAQH
jgi:dipeptidyl aminopeptidase/acylaminoacyl peptidase